jgi:hypothetical protein
MTGGRNEAAVDIRVEGRRGKLNGLCVGLVSLLASSGHHAHYVRNDHCRQYAQDCHYDQQLDQGEAPLSSLETLYVSPPFQ